MCSYHGFKPHVICNVMHGTHFIARHISFTLCHNPTGASPESDRYGHDKCQRSIANGTLENKRKVDMNPVERGNRSGRSVLNKCFCGHKKCIGCYCYACFTQLPEWLSNALPWLYRVNKAERTWARSRERLTELMRVWRFRCFHSRLANPLGQCLERGKSSKLLAPHSV